MTSQSTVGQARITLQFGLTAASTARRATSRRRSTPPRDLPASLRSNPIYRKINPAAAPIMILSLTSKTLNPGQLYDSAATVLQQKLSQVQGVARSRSAAARCPRCGSRSAPKRCSNTASAWRTCAPRWPRPTPTRPRARSSSASVATRSTPTTRHGAPHSIAISSSPIATAPRCASRRRRGRRLGRGSAQCRAGERRAAVLVIISSQPGANIIDTVDNITALLPDLEASIPSSIDMTVAMDRTTTIRASIHDVQRTLLVAIALVSWSCSCSCATCAPRPIPVVAVPVSLIARSA